MKVVYQFRIFTVPEEGSIIGFRNTLIKIVLRIKSKEKKKTAINDKIPTPLHLRCQNETQNTVSAINTYIGRLLVKPV